MFLLVTRPFYVHLISSNIPNNSLLVLCICNAWERANESVRHNECKEELSELKL